MDLYLDEDTSSALLAKLLREAGHRVLTCSESALEGASDVVQFSRSNRGNRVIVTRNHHDFEDLHDLVRNVAGHHHGILVVLSENKRRRDMRAQHVVAAIGRLIDSGLPIANEIHILNHFRS